MSIKNSEQHKKQIRKLSKSIRGWRRVHHYLGLFIALFLLLSAVTGLLLGWKKDVDILQPPTKSGKSQNLEHWLPLNLLERNSTSALNEKLNNEYQLDRIDIRPDKGIAKITYQPGYWEVQVDGSTGKILSIEKRYSDLIEQIHDGSIISDLFKLLSMNILGAGIIIMIISGLWLWFGPVKIRWLKN